MKTSKCVPVLLPALVETEEQEKMTTECRQSLVSFKHCIKVIEDRRRYETAVAGVWDNFIQEQLKNDDWDYILITANDTIADPNAIDYMVRFADENPKVGMVTGKVERNLEIFRSNFGSYEYTSNRSPRYQDLDPACFILRRQAIKQIGHIDQEFPREFVERDLIRRLNWAGWEVAQPDIVLWHHPPYAGTIGNDGARLQRALVKYIRKHGGDAGQEQYLYPYNDIGLDYTFTGKY